MSSIQHLWIDKWVEPPIVPLSENRSFLFGDGFFETMRWSPEKQCHLWDFHWNRIQKTVKALQFPWPTVWENGSFFEWVASKIPNEGLFDFRVKLVFFRVGKGRYAPEVTSPGIWFEIEPIMLPWVQTISRIGQSEKVIIAKTPFSWVKSTSALHYVMAGIEKKERNLDDLVLTDSNGFLVEGSFSSIFWSRGGKLFLPAEYLGGLDSCMRKFLIQYWNQNKIGFEEVEKSWPEVENADWIAFGSGTGIRFWLNGLQNIPFHILPEFLGLV